MKLNPIQIAASATGAVLSAVIASFFGVKGTIVGVAIGSVVATSASGLVGQWIERTHQAVRQVVIKNADQLPFLHSGRTTETAGDVATADAPVGSSREAPVDEGAPGGTSAVGTAVAETPETTTTTTSGRAVLRSHGARREVGATRLVASSSGRMSSSTSPVPRAGEPGGWWHRLYSHRLALSMGLVFVIALGVVTVVELAAGRPLSSLVGASHSSGGTSAGNLFSSTPPGPATPTTTTTAPSATSTTTTAPSGTTTTTTTAPPSTSTTTTTTSPSGTAPTTTTVPSAGPTATASGSSG